MDLRPDRGGATGTQETRNQTEDKNNCNDFPKIFRYWYGGVRSSCPVDHKNIRIFDEELMLNVYVEWELSPKAGQEGNLCRVRCCSHSC